MNAPWDADAGRADRPPRGGDRSSRRRRRESRPRAARSSPAPPRSATRSGRTSCRERSRGTGSSPRRTGRRPTRPCPLVAAAPADQCRLEARGIVVVEATACCAALVTQTWSSGDGATSSASPALFPVVVRRSGVGRRVRHGGVSRRAGRTASRSAARRALPRPCARERRVRRADVGDGRDLRRRADCRRSRFDGARDAARPLPVEHRCSRSTSEGSLSRSSQTRSPMAGAGPRLCRRRPASWMSTALTAWADAWCQIWTSAGRKPFL